MTELEVAEQTLSAVSGTIASLFSGRRSSFLELAFEKTKGLFEGNYPGYQRCDTPYHNFSHTCDVMVATARILDGHIKSGETPLLILRDFELAMAAALLHDSGLIKEVGDDEGTGARYASMHVARGIRFAGKFLPSLGVKPDEIHTVQLAIRCTEIDVDIARLKFRDERERFLGCALGAGDLLGQMAAADYPERLPSLYVEYREATQSAQRPVAGRRYQNADDLLRRTRNFYETHVRGLLNMRWAGVHRALTHHFASGRNELLEAIEDNLTRIDLVLADSPGMSRREQQHV